MVALAAVSAVRLQQIDAVKRPFVLIVDVVHLQVVGVLIVRVGVEVVAVAILHTVAVVVVARLPIDTAEAPAPQPVDQLLGVVHPPVARAGVRMVKAEREQAGGP